MDAACYSPGGFDRLREGAAAGLLPGMSEDMDALFRDALSGPGIVLVAGPRRSGKTATLDAALRFRPEALIVGEICDRETAGIAVQAALAGGLVLAAVEARDAVGAIMHLRTMKVEPFLIASTLRAVLAQRLVRRPCPDCRRHAQASANLSARLGFDPGAIIHESPGCGACAGSGYRGRTGLFEIIAVDLAMRRLVNAGGDEAVIASHAFRDRPNLAGAARAALCDGRISAEDALRLC